MMLPQISASENGIVAFGDMMAEWSKLNLRQKQEMVNYWGDQMLSRAREAMSDEDGPQAEPLLGQALMFGFATAEGFHSENYTFPWHRFGSVEDTTLLPEGVGASETAH